MKKINLFIGICILGTSLVLGSCKQKQMIQYRDIEADKVELLNQRIVEKNIKSIEEIAQLYRPKDSDAEGNYSYEVITSEKNKYQLITIKEEGLNDDSLYGILTVITLEEIGLNTWNAISIKEAYKCWPNRGHQEWGPEFCN